jgi:hypothetical protein
VNRKRTVFASSGNTLEVWIWRPDELDARRKNGVAVNRVIRRFGEIGSIRSKDWVQIVGQPELGHSSHLGEHSER